VGTQLEGYRGRLPIGPATDELLKQKACALRKALDFEACDCEYLERGSTRAGVTIVMFHVMLGC
jgi:hypothetical protein